MINLNFTFIVFILFPIILENNIEKCCVPTKYAKWFNMTDVLELEWQRIHFEYYQTKKWEKETQKNLKSRSGYAYKEWIEMKEFAEKYKENNFWIPKFESIDNLGDYLLSCRRGIQLRRRN